MADPAHTVSIGSKLGQTISFAVTTTFTSVGYLSIFAVGVAAHIAINYSINYAFFVCRQKSVPERAKMDRGLSTFLPACYLSVATPIISLLAFKDEPFWLRIACTVVGLWTAVLCLAIAGSVILLIGVLLRVVISAITSEPTKSRSLPGGMVR